MKKKSPKGLTKRQIANARSGKYKKYKSVLALFPGVIPRRPSKVKDRFGTAIFGPGF
jgi:hypothetical protein